MKILVLSDTHGKIQSAIQLIREIEPDRVIHLGDFSGDGYDLQSIFDRIPFDIVAGNCDLSDYDSPRDKIIELLGKKIWITHGHLFSVKRDLDGLIRSARIKGADAVLFGHTHRRIVLHDEGIAIMNPGSLTSPKDSKLGSYGILEIDGEGRIHLTVNTIKF